mgnify:CR=1 FL=1
MPTTAKTKPFKTFDEQLDIMISRGLIVKNRELAVKTMQHINYYRMSAYSLTLRKDDIFYTGITFENILELYQFDAGFRSIILKYVNNVENAFRTYIAHYHSEKYGPLGYLNGNNFENEWYHGKFLSKLSSLIGRSDDVFIAHHKNDLNGVYPFWVAIEVTTFDVLSKLYKNLLEEDRTYIAKSYCSVHREYVENWLQHAVVARNISAHGGRFYNRQFNSCKIKLPTALRSVVGLSTPFSFVFAIFRLLPNNELRMQFIIDLENLFSNYPFALKRHMGFPENWNDVLISQIKLDCEKTSDLNCLPST